MNKEVILLDVASLVSGTGIRGQFEERMKQLIKELQERKTRFSSLMKCILSLGQVPQKGQWMQETF